MNKQYLLKNIKPVSAILGLCFLAFVLFQIVPHTSTSSIVKNSSIKQLPSLPGEPIKWIKTASVSEINNVSHFVEVPKVANNIKISTSTLSKTKTQLSLTNKDRIKLSNLSKERSNSGASLALAESIKKQNAKGFFASISRIFSKVGSMFATVGDADTSSEVVTVDVASVVQDEIQTPVEATVPNVDNGQVEQSSGEVVSDAQATTTEENSSSVQATTTEDVSTTTGDIVGSSTEEIISSTTTINGQAEIVSSPEGSSSEEKKLSEVSSDGQATTTASNIATTTSTTTLVEVEFETPTPVIAEATTDTGKIVTVSATDTLDVPITNVLAYTNIPEIYKVGQEDKIKIKWTNNGDQNVTFHAYDLNHNGKLDYVEWTVPHLSTQTFEIIFISKAFQLDENKEIISDIYDTVKTKDNVWAPISDGQYVRVTFNKILTNKNDITIYARPVGSTPVTIEAYTTDTNQLVATFNIDHEGLYKQLIPNIASPTDVFDLKIIGDVDIDYIVDPVDLSTGLVEHYLMNDTDGTTVVDSSGNGNNGSGTYTATTGKIGGALNFNGTSNYIDLGNTADFYGTQDFSFSFWMDWQGSTNDYTSLISKEDVYNGYAILIKSNNKLAVYLSTSGSPVLYMDGLGGDVPYGVHLITVTCSASEGIRTYIDHVLDYYQSGTYSLGQNTNSALIGNSITSGRLFQGWMDDFRIYNRVLSQAEISVLATATEEDGAGTITIDGDYTVVTYKANGTFTPPTGVTSVEALVVGGGGAGGGAIGAGGGAGGYIDETVPVSEIQYNIAVGAGAQTHGVSGNSSFGDLVAIGGGNGADGLIDNAGTGGSGGGATAGNAGLGTSGQGSNGGISSGFLSGAGGGAGGVGGNGGSGVAGAGGVGIASSITGTSLFYAGGGAGGGFLENSQAMGGSGVGGNGGYGGNTSGTAGLDGTGSGGGGGSWTGGWAQNSNGGAGGSGVVILRYLTLPQDTTAPIITISSPTNNTTYSTTSININTGATDTNLGSIIPDLDNSLVSLYTMDDVNGSTLIDKMGNNNGIIVGGTTQVVGKFGKALKFNGTDSRVTFNSHIVENVFTISLWFNAKNLPPGSSDAYYMSQSSVNRNLGTRFGDTYSWTSLGAGPAIQTDTWYHIIYTYDGTNGSEYLNGNLVVGPLPFTLGVSGNLTFGSYDQWSGFFDGSLDDVAIFNRVLTPDEITALYNGTSINHTSTLSEGLHTYKAFAEDLAGNVASSSLSTFNINTDTTAPDISYSYGTPSNSSIQNSTSANVIASTTDDRGQHSVFTDWNNSLVGWWKLNGDVTDSSGNGNDGTNHGATPTIGKLGGAMSFDGTSDYVDLGSSLNLSPQHMTVSLWAKTSSAAFGVMYAHGRTPWDGFEISQVGGSLRVTSETPGTVDFWSNIGGLNDNSWHHVVLTYDGATAMIYVDGSAHGSASGNIPYNTAYDNYIGMRGDGSSFNGSIDDVQIYNRALSSDEVASLYDASANQYSHTFTGLSNGDYTFKTYAEDLAGNVSSTTPRTFNVDTTTPSVSVTSPTNNTTYSTTSININTSATDTHLGSIIPDLDSSLISWWRMDDVNGSTLTDYMGHNNGTITGATQTTGKFGKGMGFDVNNDDYIDVPDSDSLSFTDGNGKDNPFSINAWVNTKDISNNAQWIVNKRGSGGHEYQLMYYQGFLYVHLFSNNGDYIAKKYYNPFINNTWFHIVATYDGSKSADGLKIYVNSISVGEPESYGTYTGMTNTTSDLYIGRMGWTPQGYFNGSIDDVQIYNRALSPSEITALYNGTAINHTSTLADGSHTYKVFAEDLAGNVSSSTLSFIVDTTAPVVSDNVPSGWQTNNIAVTLTCSDTVSGCSKVYYTTDDSSPSTTTSSYVDSSSSWIFTESTEGTSTLKYMGIDNIGNLAIATTSINLMELDKTAPTVTVSTSTMASGTLVTFSCDDGLVGSGCSKVYYTYDGSNATINSSYVEASTSWQFLILTEGDYDLKYFGKDVAGNLGPHFIDHTRVDRTKPNTTDDFANNNIWEKTSQTINLSPSDPYPSSGLSWTRYCIDQNDTCIPADGLAYSGGVLIENEGTSYFRYASQDRERNLQGTVSRTVKIDTISPTTSDNASTSQGLAYTYGNWTNSNVTIALTPSDATSGIASTTYCISTVDNTCIPSINYSTTSPVVISSAGTTYFNYSSVDNAGNIQPTVSRTIKIDKAPPTISNISPVAGSNITSGNQITFSLNKVGDCRLALSNTAKSYDQMSEDVSCSVSNGILISCVIPSLGSSGNKSMYLACEDYIGNKDSSITATHINYTLPSLGSRRSDNSGTISNTSSSTIYAPSAYSVAINGGSWTTYDRHVSLQFSTDSSVNITGVILSDNPDFSNSSVIPYPSLQNGQHTADYDLCRDRTTCPDALYNVYAKFLDAQGISSIAVFQSITLNAVPLLTEIASTTKGIVQNIASTTANIISVVLPIKKVSPIYLPPIKTSVPEVAQFSLLNSWKDIIPSSIGKFVFTGLPSDFKNIVNKFPEVSVTLQKIGITKMSDIFKLNSVGNISLPNLSEVASVPKGQSMAFADFSLKQKKQIPTDIIFAQTAGGDVDLNVKLSVSNEGLALQTLNTIQGQPLSFVVKPEGKAKTVQGYMIFKSSKNNSVSANSSSSLLLSQTASVLGSELAQASPTIQGTTVGSDSAEPDAVDLVLNKFDYKDSGNGVWTADVASPLALGQYELRTVIDYTEKAKAPKTISMVVVVDPEGYVYKMNNGEETRINNAQVSIYWQNPKTNIYEIWPASNFRQTNPQTTDVTGRYAFLVPPGTYKLKVTSDSYLGYEGEPFKVDESKGVFINIELKEKMAWLKIVNLQNILLGIISIVLIYLAVIFTIRRGKKR